MYTEIKFMPDNTAWIIERDNEGLKKRRTTSAGAAMAWMVKQGHVWEWFKDDNGDEIAVWEKESV